MIKLLQNSSKIRKIGFINWNICKVIFIYLFIDQAQWIFYTAKRKLERLQFSTSSSFVKIWSACSCKFKAYLWTFLGLIQLAFQSRNYWSWLDHHLMVSFGKKAKIKRAGNLNKGRRYVITTVRYRGPGVTEKPNKISTSFMGGL